MAKNGLHLITPTSIAYTGTSASISANGSVTFSACSVLSLNGVFSADYDNYIIVMRHLSSGSADSIAYRLRTLGAADSGANYTRQFLYASGTSVAAGKGSSQNEGFLGSTDLAFRSGDIAYLYGPFLSQPTVSRSVNVRSNDVSNPGEIVDWVTTHNQSTSYDGLTILMVNAPRVITGRIAVYGMVK